MSVYYEGNVAGSVWILASGVKEEVEAQVKKEKEPDYIYFTGPRGKLQCHFTPTTSYKEQTHHECVPKQHSCANVKFIILTDKM